MTRFGVFESLVSIWAYHQNITDDIPLPASSIFHDPKTKAPVPLKSHIFLWDLALLAREVVLTASSWGGLSFEPWDNLANVMNRVRAIENRITDLISKTQGEDYDVLWDIYPLIHNQFEWQRPATKYSLVRYYKIFAESDIGGMIEAKTGLTMRQLYLMTFATAGNFLRDPRMLTTNDYSVIGISNAQRDAYFSLMAIDFASLREETAKQQSYDNSWSYTFNPLQARPLVRIDHKHPERVICPIPSYLMKRVSQGIFYDVASVAGFNEIYGAAFEAYVGKVLREFCRSGSFQIVGETPYTVARNQLKHGVDWTLQDSTGTVFIECKAKRVRLDAKSGANDDALHDALAIMADYVVQHYKNIIDALAGRTNWTPNGLPVYPVILTLEPWWIFNPRIRSVMESHIRKRFTQDGISEAILEEMPYTIASIDEAERAFQVIAQVGVQPFFGAKVDKEHREWALFPFFQTHFRDVALDEADQLYNQEFMALFPDAIHEQQVTVPAVLK